MEEERARLASMVEKYYPGDADRRALCMTDHISFLILAAIFSGKNPEKIFDLANEIRKEIYAFAILRLEVYGYITKDLNGRLQLTLPGQKFMEDIKKRR